MKTRGALGFDREGKVSETHILKNDVFTRVCASFCVFARLQLRHICIYEWHIGFAYRINRFGHMPDTVLPR